MGIISKQSKAEVAVLLLKGISLLNLHQHNQIAITKMTSLVNNANLKKLKK